MPGSQNRKMEIELQRGDITELVVEAIVNAANTSLLGGGGVDGAIHRAGGKEILEECKKIRNRQGGCEVGEAVITTGGKLKAKYVIHTVGPTWNNGHSKEDEKLKSCYNESMKLAEEHKVKTIAFPNISTGVYRFPKERAAKIAVEAILNWSGNKIEKVVFVCFDDENFKIYRELFKNK